MLDSLRMEIKRPEKDAQHGAKHGAESEAERRAGNIQLLTVIASILALMVAAGLLAICVSQPTWQLGVLSILYTVTGIVSVVTLRHLYPRRHLMLGLWGVSAMYALSMLASAALIKDVGNETAIVFLIFSLIISTTLSDREANLTIILGIFVSGAAALATDFWPFPQLSLPIIKLLTPAVLGALFMITVVLLAMQFVTATLRIRLVTAFLSIVIIPLSILSAIQGQFATSVLTNELNSSLRLAAQQTAIGVEQFIQDKQATVNEAASFPIFAEYLSLPKSRRAGSTVEAALKTTLQVLDTTEVNNSIYLSSFALLDEEGNNVYDTLQDRLISRYNLDISRSLGIDALVYGMTKKEMNQDYFLIPIREHVPYLSLQIISSSNSFIFISSPVKNEKGQTIGVLRARYDGELLQDLIRRYDQLRGRTSHAILVDENNIRLADTFTPVDRYKSLAPLSEDLLKTLKTNQRIPPLPANQLSTDFPELAENVSKIQESGNFTTREISMSMGETQSSEIGAVKKIKNTPWKVIYLLVNFSDEVIRKQQRASTTLVTVLIAGIVAFVALFAAQLLSSPILLLTKTARRITEGDLEASAPVESSDEFGTLGSAFNLMTSQLRALISGLEDRVRDRTKEIENQNQVLVFRAQQLRTVADVARQIVSAQELETLLSSITQLISDRFGFYHVGIFLLDDTREYAVLRAANSEGGKRMLARRHRLPVGRVGIVGYATGTGEARIALDVGADAVFFNNPDLPATRSEMALPLKAGSQVIGALDIQSEEANAFNPEDIELFNTLADQVAIAIYNNQLYLDTVRALDESQNLHRQYLRGQWSEEAARRRVLGYLYNQNGISPQPDESPLWKKVFTHGEPVYSVLPNTAGNYNQAVMAVPISVRGETIGVIHVQDQGEGRVWADDEIAVVNSIASQVAVALENARLFETTVRRAEREKRVLQITARIRSTNNPEEMMRIAVSELQQALQATRAQIYIRQEDAQAQGLNGSNGHGGQATQDNTEGQEDEE
jgi:GAF domain-containing protein/HAMP domain-containing protein